MKRALLVLAVGCAPAPAPQHPPAWVAETKPYGTAPAAPATPAAPAAPAASAAPAAPASAVSATLDGWLAYWEKEGMRYRVYPGRGAPLDHPMPLSDLALGQGSTTAERLITVIELLIEIAARGIPPGPAGEVPPEPAELA